MNDVLISIIVPVFNPDINYITQALNSALSQTFKNIEIIVVDDCSSFDYYDAIRIYLSDNRVKFVKLEKHSGAGLARNEGMKVAKGEYIAFLDCDDYYYSDDVLEKLYKIAVETSQKIVGAVPYEDKNNVVKPIYWSFHNYNKLFQNKIVKTQEYPICFGYWSFIYNRDFILTNNLFFTDLRRFQDPPWFLAVLTAAIEYYAADFPYYVHREKSIQEFNWSDSALKDYFKGLKKIVDMSLNLKYYHLYTYLYRKLFFNEYLLYKKLKEVSKFDISEEFDSLLRCFDFDVIKNTDSCLPILVSVDDFDKINIPDYKNLDY